MKKWILNLVFLGIGPVVLLCWLLGLRLLVDVIIPIRIWQYGVCSIIATVFIFNLDLFSYTLNNSDNA
jgi:hypothetical protein